METARSRTVKRSDKHYDEAGGVSCSVLLFKTARPMYCSLEEKAARARNFDPHVGERIGDAGVPGPPSAATANKSSFAKAMLCKKLEEQLSSTDRAPSGIRSTATQILKDCIQAAKDDDINSYEEYFELAGKKWDSALAERYQGYQDLHQVDMRRCTEAHIRHDWHGANERIIRLMVEGGIGPHGGADHREDYRTMAPVFKAHTSSPHTDAANDALDHMIDEANHHYEQEAQCETDMQEPNEESDVEDGMEDHEQPNGEISRPKDYRPPHDLF